MGSLVQTSNIVTKWCGSRDGWMTVGCNISSQSHHRMLTKAQLLTTKIALHPVDVDIFLVKILPQKECSSLFIICYKHNMGSSWCYQESCQQIEMLGISKGKAFHIDQCFSIDLNLVLHILDKAPDPALLLFTQCFDALDPGPGGNRGVTHNLPSWVEEANDHYKGVFPVYLFIALNP